MPLSVMLPNSAAPLPLPPPDPPLTLIATAIRIGTQASTASSAWLRRRRNTMPSSERANRSERAAFSRGTRSRTARSGASARDIEALPGQSDEYVFQAGPLDGELANAHAGPDERLDDVLGPRIAQHRVRPTVHCGHTRQAQPGEHPGRGRRR